MDLTKKYWCELFHERITKFAFTRSGNDCCLHIKINVPFTLFSGE